MCHCQPWAQSFAALFPALLLASTAPTPRMLQRIHATRDGQEGFKKLSKNLMISAKLSLNKS